MNIIQSYPTFCDPHELWNSLFFFFSFLVLPLYCYQPISLHLCAHMLSYVTPWTAAHQAPLSMDLSRQEYWSGLPFPSPPGQNTGVGSLSFLQGIFPTQGLNPGLPHCRQILYQLSHKGSPRILEWVAYPFSSRSSRSRNQTRVSCTAGRLFTNWAIREAQKVQSH